MALFVSGSTPKEVSSLSAPTGDPLPAAAPQMSSSRAPSVLFALDLAAAPPKARPPPEPPPPVDIDDGLTWVPKEDRAAIAAPDAKTADILLDMIDDKLKIPVKRQGYLDMYNGINVLQT